MSAQPQELWQLHPMRESDLPQVLDIEKRAYLFPWSEGIFKDCLKVGYSAWTIQSPAGEVLAYALMSMAVGEAHLLNLCVSPQYQGQGLARCMMDHLLQVVREAHMTILLLEVRKSNKPAISLYESYNFERLGLRKGYYPAHQGREDALVFGLQIV